MGGWGGLGEGGRGVARGVWGVGGAGGGAYIIHICMYIDIYIISGRVYVYIRVYIGAPRMFGDFHLGFKDCLYYSVVRDVRAQWRMPIGKSHCRKLEALIVIVIVFRGN